MNNSSTANSIAQKPTQVISTNVYHNPNIPTTFGGLNKFAAVTVDQGKQSLDKTGEAARN